MSHIFKTNKINTNVTAQLVKDVKKQSVQDSAAGAKFWSRIFGHQDVFNKDKQRANAIIQQFLVLDSDLQNAYSF